MPLLVASKYRSCIILLLLLSCCCQFCRLFASTVEQCQTAALERLEADAKLKRLNFGSQSYSPPKTSVSSATQRVDSDTTPKKGAGFDLLEWAKRKWGCKNLGLKKKPQQLYNSFVQNSHIWMHTHTHRFPICFVIDRFFTHSMTNHLIKTVHTS